MRRITLVVLSGLVAPALVVGAAEPQRADKAQFLAAGAKRLLQNDSDGDGKLSAAEWAAAGQGRGKEGMRERMFARLDANKDGYLDKAEIDALLARRFERKAGAQSVDGGK